MTMEEDFVAELGGEEAVKADEGLRRAAYMLARVSRENKRMKEMLEGYDELQSITNALLAIGFLYAAGKSELCSALHVQLGEDGTCCVQINKELVRGFLGQWRAMVADGDEHYDILFAPFARLEKEGKEL